MTQECLLVGDHDPLGKFSSLCISRDLLQREMPFRLPPPHHRSLPDAEHMASPLAKRLAG